MSWSEDNIELQKLIAVGISMLVSIVIIIVSTVQDARRIESLTNQLNQISYFCKDLCKKSYANIDEIFSCIEKCEIKKEE